MALIEKLQEIKTKVAPKIQPTKLNQVFSDDTEVEYLDLRNIDTSKCNQISNPFTACSNLKKINMSTWNTEKLIGSSIVNFFSACSSLEEVDLSIFDLKKITSYRGWFNYCSSLKEIKLDITNVTTSSGLQNTFRNCTSLEKLDFSGTENVQVSIDISTTGLTTQGLMDMLDTLPQLEEGCYTTIIIGEEKLSLLTEEQVAIFYEKGYTLM